MVYPESQIMYYKEKYIIVRVFKNKVKNKNLLPVGIHVYLNHFKLSQEIIFLTTLLEEGKIW